MDVRASECLYVRAHTRIGGAAAHNRPRRIGDRPSASGTHAVAKAAHTSYNVVTRAVFHAPMFALNLSAL